MQLLKTTHRLVQTGWCLFWLAVSNCRVRRIEPTELRSTFERLGGTYIKLGQFIASTPSLFPRH